MQTAADMSIEMANKETEQTTKLPTPISRTIISTNGLKITSRLNPDAKEFYPSYLLRQKIMRETGDVGGGSALTQSLHLTHNANVLKVMKIDDITGSNAIGGEVNALKEKIDDVKAKEADAIQVVEEIKAPNVTEPVKSNNDNDTGLDVELKEELKKKQDGAVVLATKVTVLQLNLDTGKTTKQVEEDVRGSEEDSTDFEDAEGEPMIQPVSTQANKLQLNQLELKNAETKATCNEGETRTVRNNNSELSENVSDEENREQYSDQSSNETLNEFKCKEDTESVEVSELSEENELAEEEVSHELPQILEEIKEFNSLCGDGDGDVECEADGICECVGIGDGDGDVPPEHNTLQPHQQPTNETDIDIATGGSTETPPETPNDMCKSPTGKSRLGKVKLLKEKEDKKKTEKRTTLRKLASISLSLRGKNSTHHSEKTSTRSSSSVMTRTKRLSESLHNLTMGHKPKTDSKKTEGSSRLLPRSATNIPRPPTARARMTLSRATTESNGMNYKAPKTCITSSVSTANHSAPKDTTSLKSVSSTEQSLAAKTTTHTAKKSLVSKSSNAALEKSGIPTVTATKSKDSVGKVRPRGTHASTLRQNEAQKRRNLFPNNDVESNIELSQFLFK
ncbi:PREDICTED: uncharacterized protein LOC108973729 isoform X2 [Bactrocera latifrons]|uniref:Uncharacterized protein n=1 Tax=Bactrocera latifrons TaxID=174628 RepID=A0A0K8V8L1_BACLA|nr:PREDICTED: uncharacterized protein LOC108973729 isoform X2 [Bactrocera latifrons]